MFPPPPGYYQSTNPMVSRTLKHMMYDWAHGYIYIYVYVYIKPWFIIHIYKAYINLNMFRHIPIMFKVLLISVITRLSWQKCHTTLNRYYSSKNNVSWLYNKFWGCEFIGIEWISLSIMLLKREIRTSQRGSNK